MDTNEIAFIICKNDTSWFEECVRYIHDLYIPEGYTVDILSIEDAETVPLAYNAALESSKAKYKIYLREDTLILHRDLIPDILNIFNEDSSIGMIGMVGCQKVSTGEGGKQHWDMGRVYVDDGACVRDCDLRSGQNEKARYAFAEAIDGFLMATQYDLKWKKSSWRGEPKVFPILCRCWRLGRGSLSHGRKNRGVIIGRKEKGKRLCANS